MENISTDEIVDETINPRLLSMSLLLSSDEEEENEAPSAVIKARPLSDESSDKSSDDEEEYKISSFPTVTKPEPLSESENELSDVEEVINAGGEKDDDHLQKYDFPHFYPVIKESDGENSPPASKKQKVDLTGGENPDLFGQSGEDRSDQSGNDLFGQSGNDLFGQSGDDLFGQSGDDLFDQSGEDLEASIVEADLTFQWDRTDTSKFWMFGRKRRHQ